MADERQSASWWQAVPDILKTVGAVVAGLTALVVALNQTGLFGSAEPPMQPPVQTVAQASARVSPSVSASELCLELSDQAIFFVANNYPGIVGPTGLNLSVGAEGTHTFSSNVVFSTKTDQEFSSAASPGEIDDPLSGRCSGSTLTFTRELRDHSHQTYAGVIARSSEGTLVVTGKFRDEEENEFTWAGRVGDPLP